MYRFRNALVAVLTIVALGLMVVGTAAANPASNDDPGDITQEGIESLLSGPYDFSGSEFGTSAMTFCPQAGKIDQQPHPTQSRNLDRVEQVSINSDRRANQDYSCQPQDETTIDVNPLDPNNMVGGANDYRIGTGLSGFYTSSDNGQNWYDGLQVIPSQANSDVFDGGGDPAVVFDRDGIAYYADLGFNRTDHSSGIFVHRSGNGGFTWSRPRQGGAAANPRIPGDGVVDYQNGLSCPAAQACSRVPVQYDVDKEYIAAGPRPAGVSPQCFDQSHAPITCDQLHTIGVDRLYVTWTRFSRTAPTSNIYESYSDDQARSWSPAHLVSTSAPFCAFGVSPTACDADQGSTPTVAADGTLYVGYENFNTYAENQYFVSRSDDGGNTFQPPSRVDTVFDINYPHALINRPDCAARGIDRNVLTNSCFRVNAYGNVVVDKRPGFENNVYVVFDDNRNGTPESSNVDVFFYRSTDGGHTWVGPTRVNDDRSTQPLDSGGQTLRDCSRYTTTACPTGPNGAAFDYGNDNYFPWMDIDENGNILIGFEDRRLDTDSVASEWPTSRQRPGNYRVWFFGATCQVTKPTGSECTSPIGTLTQPTGPSTDFDNTVYSTQKSFPFQNFQISDNPSNWDYSFGNGVFAGDYSGVSAIGGRGYALWTDARNGRGSFSGTNHQPGRNPACEQSDVFFDSFSLKGNGLQPHAASTDQLFDVTPCPLDMTSRANGGTSKG